MSCTDAREWLSDVVDDALEPEARAQLDAHLAGCADCRRELDHLRATVSMLHAVERPRAPAGFAERVLAAARPVPWHRRLRDRLAAVRVLRFPVEAAAVVVVATLAVYVFTETPSLRRAAQFETASDQRAETAVRAERLPASPDTPSWTAAPAEKEEPAKPPREGAPAPTTPPTSVRAPEPLARQGAEVPAKAEEPQPIAGKAVASGDRAASPAPPTGSVAPGPPSSPAPPVGSAGPVLPASPAPPPAASVAPSSSPPAPPVPGSASTMSPGGAAEGRLRSPQSAEARRGDAATGAAAGHPSPVPVAPELGDRSQRESNQTRGERSAPLPEPRAPAPTALRLAPSSQVIGRLAVRDRQAANRELADLLTRVGGTEKARRADAAGTLVDVVIPRANYPMFAQGLSRIGTWQPAAAEPTELPEEVPVTLRITQ